jgi:hypothetical protein
MDRADAVMPIQQVREQLGFLRVDAEHHARLAPRLLERVTHVARHWR